MIERALQMDREGINERRLPWMIRASSVSSPRSSKVKEGVKRVRARSGSMRKPLWLAQKMQEGATSHGMQEPLETGKDTETDSPLEPPEVTQPC